ncbi:choice-of-anchor X domain-containing protein [Ideonella margarita]|uniref:Choice-of-anchor X domain-containing protein n=1 Tax=Ideonella margarita TaxID=2984191 RepID=A0ABU9C811_9BURK
MKPLRAGLLVVAAVALVGRWWLSADASADTAEAPAAAASAPALLPDSAVGGFMKSSGAGPRVPADPAARAAERALWQARLQRATQVRDAYRDATRYPHDSRPLREHPDQIYPNRPITEEAPLRLAGKEGNNNIRLRTWQDKVHLAAGESAKLAVSAVDVNGQVLPLVVQRAVLHQGATGQNGSTMPEVNVAFHDDGTGGDEAAGDGIWTTTVQPANQGFAELAGVLRLSVALQSGEQPGFVYFDMISSPDAPAKWTGRPREAMANGSLQLQLPLEVRTAGRYVVTGRVDDANGKPVALVSFNDELGSGNQTVSLPLFGKLVRDLQPSFPLTLRDVDAFLLRADTFPDRSMLPRRVGRVLQTRSYPLTAFSDAEWQSEERSRHLTEYDKDVAQAKARLEQLAPPEQP